MTWSDHSHSEYAGTSHTHGFYDLYDVAGEHHRHYDLESEISGLREDLGRALERIGELEERQFAVESQTPQARQLQFEADQAAADLAASGYDQDPPIGADRHGPGCLCPYCPDEDEPEPEAEDPTADPMVAEYLQSLEQDALDGPHFYDPPEDAEQEATP